MIPFTDINEISEISRRSIIILLDVGMKGLIVLGAAGLVTLALRRASAATKHLVWTLALSGLLFLPAISLIIPSWQLPVLPNTIPVSDNNPSNMSERQDFQSIVPVMPPIDTVMPISTAEGKPIPLTTTSTAEEPKTIHWSFWVLVAWLLGSLVALVPLILGILIVQRKIRKASHLKGESWQSLIRSSSNTLHIKRKVHILKTAVPIMPLICGIFRPVVLLPKDAENWPDDKRRMVVLHELGHLKRWDCMTQMLVRVACSLHWFNPLAWLAMRRLRVERERACDDLVINAGSRPSKYADHLLEFARVMRTYAFASTAAITMARPSQLEGRLLAILDTTRNRRTFTKWTLALTLMIAVIVILPLAAVQLSAPGQYEALVYAEEIPANLEATVIKGFRENRDRLKNVVLSWTRTVKDSMFPPDWQGNREEPRQYSGTYQLWWDGKRIATKYLYETYVGHSDGSVKKEKFEGGNLYKGSVFSNKTDFKLGENWLKAIRWCGSESWVIDTSIENMKKKGNLKMEWSTLEVDGNTQIKLVIKDLKNELGFYVLFFDPSRGCNLIREEWYDSQGHLIKEDYIKLQEVSGGVWFPVEVESKLKREDIIKGTSHIHHVLDMERCSFNDASAIPDEVFSKSFVASSAVEMQKELTKILKEIYENQKDREIGASTYKKRERAVDTVKGFIVTARAGDHEGIRKYIDSKSINPDEVWDSVETLLGKFSLEALCADDKSAMVISSVIHTYQVTEPLVFYLKNIDGAWLLYDIDFESLEIVQRELSKFLKEQPDATIILLSTRFPEWMDTVSSILKDNMIAQSEIQTLHASTEKFYNEFGIQFE